MFSVCAVLSTTGSCPTLGPRLGAHGAGNEPRVDPNPPFLQLGLNLAATLLKLNWDNPDPGRADRSSSGIKYSRSFSLQFSSCKIIFDFFFHSSSTLAARGFV